MAHFVVTLKENIDDKFTVTHNCEAMNHDAAEDDALQHYPDHTVINITLLI